ncbi:MAG: maltotransferase domain-containing protein, partial [Vulcanimicrobiaceae bacterium]
MGVATVSLLALREPIVIQNVEPELDCGRHPVKRELGDWLVVRADIFREGHDVLCAAVLYRSPQSEDWHEAPLRLDVNDRWEGAFPLDRIGRWRYTFESWTDRWASWVSDTRKKRDAAQNIELELTEGRLLVERVLSRVTSPGDRDVLVRARKNPTVPVLLSTQLSGVMQRYADRSRAARYDKELVVVVDRERARFAAWYELFPRSQSSRAGMH